MCRRVAVTAVMPPARARNHFQETVTVSWSEETLPRVDYVWIFKRKAFGISLTKLHYQTLKFSIKLENRFNIPPFAITTHFSAEYFIALCSAGLAALTQLAVAGSVLGMAPPALLTLLSYAWNDNSGQQQHASGSICAADGDVLCVLTTHDTVEECSSWWWKWACVSPSSARD